MSEHILYSLEELKKKSELALKDPKLVEIAKTAPLNTKNKPNLSWAYNEAFFYALGQTNDLKKSKELALSTRFLAMLRRDYPVLFEELLKTQTRQPEPKKEIPEPPEKKFEEIETEIPHFVELITIESMQSHFYTVPLKKRFMKFPNEYSYSCIWTFCLDILNKMVERELSKNPKGDFKKYFINDHLAAFIEEKFGLEPLIEILEKRGFKVEKK